MLYNTGYRFTKFIESPSQEEIYNCPRYGGVRPESIRKSAPSFLLRILDQFPWNDRPQELHVRVQDFRTGITKLPDSRWHCDTYSRLLAVSFGSGCRTEFIKTPLELEDYRVVGMGSVLDQFNALSGYNIESPPFGQLAEYTPFDFHRLGAERSVGGLRLFIVSFDCDDIPYTYTEPSLREQEDFARSVGEL